MHQYIVVGEPKDCPKLFETQRPSIGWIKRPKLAVRLNSAISYIKFQTGRSMSNYKSLLSSKQVITKSKPVDQYLIRDRKSTRLNSSHLGISYAVFCLKKK